MNRYIKAIKQDKHLQVLLGVVALYILFGILFAVLR